MKFLRERAAQFDDAELAQLTLAIVAINGWNRLNVGFRMPAGDYQPGMLKKSGAALISFI